MSDGPPPGMFHADMADLLAKPLSPAKPLPVGAWDCHAHVFGPFEHFPAQGTSAYMPPDAPANDYVKMLDKVGFSHGVVVQPAAYGYDNAALLDALTRHPDRLRGIAVVDPDTSDEVLRALNRAGVRGVRVTEAIGGRSLLGTELLRIKHIEMIAPKLARAGLHIQLWAGAQQIAQEAERLARLPIPVVFDHFGQIDMSHGVEGADFRTILDLFKLPHIWAKVQPLRVSRIPEDRSMIRPFFDALTGAAPDRLLWGTDWPFIALGLALPDPGKLIDEFREWADPAMLETILVKNPARLYG